MPSRVSSSKTKARNLTAEEETPDEGADNNLRARICTIFQEIQRSSTSKRTLVVALRKLQESCCYESTNIPQQADIEDDFDENDFAVEMLRCMLRVLTVKKSEPVGDRIVRFLGLYLRHATDLDNAIFAEEEAEKMQGLPETPTSRLIVQIISTLMPLLQAREKTVRFRCTQIVSHLINTLDSVDDELFHDIRLGLLKRLRDKESSVRVQAVRGLGRLAGENEAARDIEDSDDDTAGAVLDRLLDVLQHDPSAEVRRSLLLNLPFTPSTLPYLLERARDLDASIRRALYARLLPALGDFRHLSLTHREKLLRWGLRDRDENVRKAAGCLFRERWIEDCARPQDENGVPIELQPARIADASSEALLELLERIDVVNAGSDGGVALDAMREFWAGRPDYRDYITFGEPYWQDLTPESVFIARTFNDYCRQEGISDALVEKLPEVTRLAYLLQSNINALSDLIQRINVDDDADEDSAHQEFIVEQLLQIALTLDYSDEIGRRTMFGLMREALSLPALPEEATRLVVEVLKYSCGSNSTAEREFCSVVLEAIADIHDTIMDDRPADDDNQEDSFVSAQSELSSGATPQSIQNAPVDEERAIKEVMVNMKCLHIAQCMLQNVEANLEDNSDLVTMLNNLVVPAVRSQEAPIRERGLLCLGLCCLLDRNLAEENLTLFLHCFGKGHEELQIIAIQIIGDVLTAHPSLLLSTGSGGSEDGEDNTEEQPSLDKPIHKMFTKSLKSSIPQIQSTACAALSKLMLSAAAPKAEGSQIILRVNELLQLLVMAYFDPGTASNSALRQALSYFIPVYCHSRRENMECMASITLDILHWYINLKDEFDVEGEDEVESELVGMSTFTNHLVDWTDGRRLALARNHSGDSDAEADSNAHLDLAERILDKLLSPSSREEKKQLLALLGKLHIRAGQSLNLNKAHSVLRLVNDAIEERLASDAPSRNALTKLHATLTKAISSKDDQAQSSEPSRAQSVAPSFVQLADEHINDAEILDTAGALDGMTLDSISATPAVRPRKRSSRQSPGRQTVSHAVSEHTGDGNGVTAAASVSTTPMPSPFKHTELYRTAEAESSWQGDGSLFDQENIPPPSEPTPAASPQKKMRGYSKRSTRLDLIPGTQGTTAAPDTQGKTEVKVGEEETSERLEEVPLKKSRGRAPRVLAVAPRKSVRAGRRKDVGDVE